MTRESKLNKRLVALFLLGCVLFNYPILSLFNFETPVFGLPLLLVYIFGVWCLLIGLIALATMFRKDKKLVDTDDAGGR